MIKLIFNQLETHNRNLFYSDMLAAQDIQFSSENNTFVTETTSGQLYDFYADEIANPNTKWKYVNPYDFKNKCHMSQQFTTLHFSHHSCGRMWFCRKEAYQDIDGNLIKQQRRGEVARKWLEAWKLQCGNEFNKLV